MSAGRRAGFEAIKVFQGVIWLKGQKVWYCPHVHDTKEEAQECSRAELDRQLAEEGYVGNA